MNRFIVLAVAIACVAAEAPLPGGYSGGGSVSAGRNFASGGSNGGALNEYVDEALLARVAAVIESDGDGTAQGQSNDGAQYVDDSIFTRVAASLGGSGSSGSRSSSGAYGAPAPSGDASLGQPEPARRIAEWDLSEQQASRSQGGYSGQQSGGYAAPAPAPQQPSGGYGAPAPSRSSGGSVSLGQPEPAQRVAEWDATEQQASRSQSQGGYSQGSQGGYNN